MTKRTSIAILQGQFKFAHEWLEGCMEHVTPEVAHWLPPAGLAPIAAHYLHTLASEDQLVNAATAAHQPLVLDAFITRIGCLPPPPGDWLDWARNMCADLHAIRAYGDAVARATDAQFAQWTDDDLFVEIDANEIGAGVNPRWDILSLALLDLHAHSGEISALKGLQGLRGYPI